MTKQFLTDFLIKIPEKDTIYSLVKKGVIAVIKKDETYLNLCYEKYYTPRIVGGAYCKGTTYMFGGLAVYNLYGFTTQLAQQYLIYSPLFLRERSIYGMDFVFKAVKPNMLYGMVKKKDRGEEFFIMNRERAFIEFCRENPEKIRQLREIYQTSLKASKLENLLKKYPYQTTRNFIQKQIIECTSSNVPNF